MTYATRVARATANDDWQAFRESLKGLSTKQKLVKLKEYWDGSHGLIKSWGAHDDCDYCIRVDNYLKALARGGQLHRGVNLKQAIESDWKLKIRK